MARVRSELPAGTLVAVDRDRYGVECDVRLIRAPAPAPTSRFFSREIPRWRRLGIALNLEALELGGESREEARR